MKKYYSPEFELIRLDVVDIITDSGEAAPTTAPRSTVKDKGLDNEQSAKIWEF